MTPPIRSAERKINADDVVTDVDLARLRAVCVRVDDLRREALDRGEVSSLEYRHVAELMVWRQRRSTGASHAERLRYEQAEKQILRCITAGQEQLFLGNMELGDLPEIVWHLRWLKQLHIGGNKLIVLPSEIGQLGNLTHLTAGKNRLQDIPQSISRLERLEVLDLSFNFIARVPDVFLCMDALRFLYLNHNLIPTMPATLSRLPQHCTVLLSPELEPTTEAVNVRYPRGASGPAVITVRRPNGLPM